MQKSPNAPISSLLLLCSITSILGLLFGYLGWGVALGLAIWAFLQIRQIRLLQQWLIKPESTPPESTGFWGDIFDELARIQKRHRNRSKELKEVILRFQQSSSALPDAVVIIDSQNNLEWWNRSADRLLGFKASADRGKPVINLLRDPRFIRYFRKGVYAEPIQLPAPVSNDMVLQFQITEFGVGDRLLIARDITQIVRLEQTRQDFVANASHELRTPLTVIRGYLETFLDQELPAPMSRALTQMQTQASRMESLVADLLLLSRLESSQHLSDEAPVNIRDMLKTIQQAAKALAPEKQQAISLVMDSEDDLLGQPQELYSAFSNLVFNAVRYTPANKAICIRWWTDNQGGHLSVQDEGLGIDSKHIPRLTERFYRVDEGRSSATGGTGLGLAIVKHALQRHGGKLTIESKLGKGSTFTCHFPSDMVSKNDQAA